MQIRFKVLIVSWLCACLKKYYLKYRIARVIFGGQNIRGSAIDIYSQFVVLFSWLLLALQVKVGKVASFVGKILWSSVQPRQPRIFCPHENYPLYTVVSSWHTTHNACLSCALRLQCHLHTAHNTQCKCTTRNTNSIVLPYTRFGICGQIICEWHCQGRINGFPER